MIYLEIIEFVKFNLHKFVKIKELFIYLHRNRNI